MHAGCAAGHLSGDADDDKERNDWLFLSVGDEKGLPCACTTQVDGLAGA